MVSTKTLNAIVFTIKDFMLDAKNISDISKVSLEETKYALKVLVSRGYVYIHNSKGVHKGENYYFTYYYASESAKEILIDGGFKKQLSMKENSIKKSKTINKNISINNSTVGDVNYESLFSESPKINSVSATPDKNDAKSIFYKIYEWINNNKILCGIILAILIGILKKQKLFSWLNYILN